MLASPLGARKEGIPRAIQGRDRQPVGGNLGQELAAGIATLQHVIEPEVRRDRPIAASELQALDVKRRGRVEHRIEAHVRQAIREHSDLHATRFDFAPIR
jgi:hypothetical protein